MARKSSGTRDRAAQQRIGIDARKADRQDIAQHRQADPPLVRGETLQQLLALAKGVGQE